MLRLERIANRMELAFPWIAAGTVCCALATIAFFRSPVPSSVTRLVQSVYEKPIGPQPDGSGGVFASYDDGDEETQPRWKPDFVSSPTPKAVVVPAPALVAQAPVVTPVPEEKNVLVRPEPTLVVPAKPEAVVAEVAGPKEVAAKDVVAAAPIATWVAPVKTAPKVSPKISTRRKLARVSPPTPKKIREYSGLPPALPTKQRIVALAPSTSLATEANEEEEVDVDRLVVAAPVAAPTDAPVEVAKPVSPPPELLAVAPEVDEQEDADVAAPIAVVAPALLLPGVEAPVMAETLGDEADVLAERWLDGAEAEESTVTDAPSVDVADARVGDVEQPGAGFDEYSFSNAPAVDGAALIAPALPVVGSLQPNDYTAYHRGLEHAADVLNALPTLQAPELADANTASPEIAAAPKPEPELVLPAVTLAPQPELAVASPNAPEIVPSSAPSSPEPELVLPKAAAPVAAQVSAEPVVTQRVVTEEAPTADVLAQEQAADEAFAEAALADEAAVTDLGPTLVVPKVAPQKVASNGPVAVASEPTLVRRAKQEEGPQKGSAPLLALAPLTSTAKAATRSTDVLRSAQETMAANARVFDAREEFAKVVGPPAPSPAATTAVVAAVNEDAAQLQTSAPETRGFGRLRFRKLAEEWLERTQGHVELKLQPSVTAGREDLPVTYKFPYQQFSFEIPDDGRYHLSAVFFKQDEVDYAAVVPFKAALHQQNIKSSLEFEITDEAFEAALAAVSGEQDFVSLTLTVATAGSSQAKQYGVEDVSYTQPIPVPGARAQVLFVKDFVAAPANEKGIIRFARVSAHSELFLKITAPDHLPAYVVVPVGARPAYQPVYLVPTSLSDLIPTYILGSEQRPDYGVLMGRVFNAGPRPTPKANVELSLRGKKNPVVYFGAGGLPIKAMKRTSQNGLFFMPNLPPSYEPLEQDKAVDSVPYLVSLRPGAGTYVELGRSGKKGFRGRFVNPFSNRPVTGTVRLMGTTDIYPLDARGAFELPAMDFPADAITLELDGDDTGVTLVTVPWSTRFASKERTLYVIPEAKVDAAIKRETRTKRRDDAGLLVAGAEPSFFAKQSGCYSVELKHIDLGDFGGAYGPYALLGDKKHSGPLCVQQQNSGVLFTDLPPGPYQVLWKDAKGRVVRVRAAKVNVGRTAVVVN